MNTQTYRVRGMHCASCSAIIEKTLKKVEGVQSVQANFGTETAKISFDESKTDATKLSKKIEHLGYSLLAPRAFKPCWPWRPDRRTNGNERRRTCRAYGPWPVKRAKIGRSC